MKNEKYLIVLAFIAVYIIWGSTYLFNKMLLEELPAFQLSGIRFLISGFLIFCFALVRGIPLKISGKQLRNTCYAGFIFLTLGNGLLVLGLRYLDTGFTALLIAAQPLNLLIMLWIWKGQKIKKKSIIGVLLGLFGIYLLMYSQGFSSAFSWKGVGFVFVSMLSWGYASIYVGDADLPKNQFVNSAYQMFIGGIFLLVLSPILGEEWENPFALTVKGYLSFGFLIIFGAIVAFSSFNYLLKKVSPEKVATSAYVNPLVAVILGYLILGEKLDVLTLMAALVLLTGVYFINSTKSKTIEGQDSAN